MFKTVVDINRKDYLNCSYFYLKKYLGLREILLISFLVVAGLVLGIWVQNMFVLIMCGVTVVLMAAAVLFYMVTSGVGYKMEFQKRGAEKWEMEFNDDGFTVTIFEKEANYSEKRLYKDIDKIAVRRDRVYLFCTAALMYYIPYDKFTEGNFVEFCEFLKTKADEDKFKMKVKRKKY